MTNNKQQITNNKLPEMDTVWQQTLNWLPDEQCKTQFQHLYKEILEGNRQLNLTRITNPEEFWEKHLWDSLRGVVPGLTSLLTKPQQVIDIGTGAGFPGIPVAIAFPHIQVTLLDSTRKKINFLSDLIPRLGLNNVTTLIGRAEAIRQQQHRKQYDLALIRAVGKVSVCAEYALPLLKTGGLAILYRGHWNDEEKDALIPVLEQLGGVIESIEQFTTPLSNSVRHCLYLRVK
ncbi:MAG: 16S rRNA (guanine(527)-N(7))-methyltransferase RsmG [Symploca sp. SIO1C2]|nr:16S rRNA (guanine(527)-N(7))-methyltransferase RsmG [Symploca sp. SIO1C2]